jgi:hypothetical protein
MIRRRILACRFPAWLTVLAAAVSCRAAFPREPGVRFLLVLARPVDRAPPTVDYVPVFRGSAWCLPASPPAA